MPVDFRIGIDLGGTKIELIVLDEQGETLLRERAPTPAGDYQDTINAIVELVERAERKLGGRGSIGIGTPGAPSPTTGLLRNSNSVCLNGRPFDLDLSAALDRPVKLSNDANCFALSEAVDGAAKGKDIVFGVILGTGVGGGIVVDGKALSGPNAITGEWGHNPLPWPRDDELPGPNCYCGKYGCIETWVSGPGLAADFAGTAVDRRAPPEIAQLADQGNDLAEHALRRYEDRLARALASVINIVDPRIIVLGGGLSNLDRLYRNLPALWGRYVFSDHVNTPLVPARYGDSSGVRGAAWLWRLQELNFE